MAPRLQQEKKTKFLAAYAECGTIPHAALAAGVDRGTAVRWRKSDPRFAARFETAEEQATDGLEAEARRRAFEGVEEPVFHQGVRIATVRKYSDTLLIVLLKMKGRFVEQMRHAGPSGEPLERIGVGG